MHLAGRSYSAYLENPRGPKWWRFAAREVCLSSIRARKIFSRRNLPIQAEHRFPDLPRGPVHADLFRDNALCDDGRISGVVDFYFAGVDCLLYDLAVCANDWCLRPDMLWMKRGSARCSPATTACGRSPRSSARRGGRCCARRRCASGCRGSMTSTCRARDAGARARPRAFPPRPGVAHRRCRALDDLMQARIVDAQGGALARRRLAPVPRRAARLDRAGVRLLADHDAGFRRADRRRRRGSIMVPAFSVGFMAAARAAARAAGRARPALRRLPPSPAASSSSAWSISPASRWCSPPPRSPMTARSPAGCSPAGVRTRRRCSPTSSCRRLPLRPLYAPVLMMFWFAPPLAAWHGVGRQGAVLQLLRLPLNWRAVPRLRRGQRAFVRSRCRSRSFLRAASWRAGHVARVPAPHRPAADAVRELLRELSRRFARR